MSPTSSVHYLDNASTTQVFPQVAQLLSETLCDVWANPASLYHAGLAAEDTLTDARKTLSVALGCLAKEVYFTSGGTEANNIAVLGAARARKAWAEHIVCTGYEHPSVLGAVSHLASEEGFSLTKVMPKRDGRVNIDEMVSAVGPKTALVCAMHVNNESGAVLDVAALCAAVKAKNPRTFVHVDGVQGFCKVPLVLSETKIDSYSTSGHKLHAPKGVGALYVRSGANIQPLCFGGGQQQGLRPGTEAPALAAAYAKAVQLVCEKKEHTTTHIAALHKRLVQSLWDIDELIIHSPSDASPYIVFFSMPAGLKSQIVLNHLDAQFGVCVSAGSACNGEHSSHTLGAMGVPIGQIDTALRVSICAQTTEADIDELLLALNDAARNLARKANCLRKPSIQHGFR